MKKDEAGILAQLKKKTDAYANRQVDGVMDIYLNTEDTIHFDIIEGQPGHPEMQTGWKDGRRTGGNFVDAMEGPIIFHPIEPRVLISGDLGVCYAPWKLSCTPKDGGPKIDTKLRLTTVFQWIGDEWIIVHDHISVPQDRDEARWMFGAKYLDEVEDA